MSRRIETPIGTVRIEPTRIFSNSDDLPGARPKYNFNDYTITIEKPLTDEHFESLKDAKKYVKEFLETLER